MPLRSAGIAPRYLLSFVLGLGGTRSASSVELRSTNTSRQVSICFRKVDVRSLLATEFDSVTCSGTSCGDHSLLKTRPLQSYKRKGDEGIIATRKDSL
jgi:hypothetical protein